jgi:hypothetical protein
MKSIAPHIQSCRIAVPFFWLKYFTACLVFFSVVSGVDAYPHGSMPATISQQDAVEAWNDFKTHGLTSDRTPGPNMLRTSLEGVFSGNTAGEFQAWSLIMAVAHDDHETAQKLWNYCKHYIPSQKAGLVPWLIKGPDEPSNWSVGDACFDYAIALDMAARKWPKYVDDEGKTWADWAEKYINSIYAFYRAIETNPASPNAISGKGYDTDTHLYARGRDEHYYLHYSPYGYLKNWQARTGNRNWTEQVGDLSSVYETEIGLQRWNLSSYYGEETAVNNTKWPLHQVRKDGTPADDMANVYDSPWNVFNHDSGRVTLRAAHAYLNYGDSHGAKMMRLIADRFLEETGGDPTRVRTGYKGIDDGARGWGAPNSWMIGNAAVAAMVDEEYRPMLDSMAQALADYDPATSKRPGLYRIGKAYYLMHLVGLMDFRIEGAAKIDRVDAIEQ